MGIGWLGDVILGGLGSGGGLGVVGLGLVGLSLGVFLAGLDPPPTDVGWSFLAQLLEILETKALYAVIFGPLGLGLSRLL